MEFGSIKGMDIGLTYTAFKNGELDIIGSDATDGRISAFNLLILEDDKQYFPPYYAVPIIRMKTLEAHPELEEVLNLLAGRIDDNIMSKLNGEVDMNGRQPDEVAVEWLKSEGLMQ